MNVFHSELILSATIFILSLVKSFIWTLFLTNLDMTFFLLSEVSCFQYRFPQAGIKYLLQVLMGRRLAGD